MKEVTPDEASRLKEKIICKSCVDSAYSVLDAFEKEFKKYTQQLANIANKGRIALEEIIHSEIDE